MTERVTEEDRLEGNITTEVRGRILLIGFNRPEKYNGFTPRMGDELVAAWAELEENDELWAGVVFGHGDHMTAGLDLPKWRDRPGRGVLTDPDSNVVDPMGLGRKCRKPIVAAVHGITYTLGIELMLACDIVVAASDCRFAQIEPLRAIMAAGGATFRFIDRGGWGNAMYHLLRCDEFDAEEARRVGMVQEIVEPGRELDRAIELAEDICRNAPLSVQATKESARTYVEKGEAACIDGFPALQARLREAEDSAEGLQSFIERRQPVFTGR